MSDAITTTLKREWFRRIWVLQEVLNGQGGDSRTVVMCGSETIDWRLFACLCECLRSWYQLLVIESGDDILSLSLFDIICAARPL